MANEISVEVKIDGLSKSTSEIKDLTDALNKMLNPTKKAKEQAEDFGKSIESIGNRAFSRFRTEALGAITAVGALFAGKEIIQAAEEKERAINSLNVTLGSLGIYSKDTSEELIKFAEGLEKTTKFSDDQVISTTTLLGTMTRLNKEGLEKSTKLALDLSTAYRIDLDAATRLVGKGIEGNTVGLARYGIKVKEGKNETENLANMMKALGGISGRSEKDLNTFAGSLSYLKNGFNNVLEEIGNFIVRDPLISDVIKNIGRGFFQLADTIKSFGINFTDALIKGIETLLSFGLTFNTVIQGIEAIITTIAIFAFINLGLAIRKFVSDSITLLSEFNVALQNTTVRGALALQGLALASNAATAAMRVLTSVISAGLLLVITELVFLLVNAKNEVGSWANLFIKAGLNIQILFKGLQVSAEEYRLKINELFASFGDKIQGFVNKYRSLFNLPPIVPEVKDQNFSESAKRVQQLNSEIAALDDRINKMSSDAKKDDLFVVQRENLLKLKEEFKKAQSIINSPKGKDNPLIDTKKIEDDFKSLYKALEGADKGELGRIQAVYDQKKKIIDDYLKYNVDEDGKAKKALAALDADTLKQKNELAKKQKEEADKLRQEEINKAKENPVGAMLEGILPKMKAEFQLNIAPKILGSIQGLGEAIGKGAEGAADILSKGAAGAINLIAPGLGNALQPFIDMFMKGPEFVEKMLTQFISGIPKIITNFISAIPAFFLTITREVPKMIDALVKEAPKVIFEFIKSIPQIIAGFMQAIPLIINSLIVDLPRIVNSFIMMIPDIVINFIITFVKNIPYLVAQIAVAIYNSIVNLFNNAVSSIGDFFGFAKGGQIVKGGVAGKDSVPAALMPGELVVDRSTTLDLQNFLKGESQNRTQEDNTNVKEVQQTQNNNSDVVASLLVKVIDLLSKPQSVSTQVNLNNKTLADILINMNRTNVRTA